MNKHDSVSPEAVDERFDREPSTNAKNAWSTPLVREYANSDVEGGALTSYEFGATIFS